MRRDFLPALEREFAEFQTADVGEDVVRRTLATTKLALTHLRIADGAFPFACEQLARPECFWPPRPGSARVLNEEGGVREIWRRVGRGRGNRLLALIAVTGAVVAAWPSGRTRAEGASGPAELFRLGVQALQEGRYADAASMFRLSNDMERRVETTCNLATTYDQWSGHEQQALEAYQACAAEDTTGQFRSHAQERVAALRARLQPAAAVPAPQPAGPQVVPVAVTWQVTNSTQGCFFFSGPGRLGQRDQLSSTAQWAANGPQAALTFSGGQSFTGTRSGAQVSLSRRSTHTYEGVWIVDETIQGAFSGNALVASYQYRECEQGNPRNCPTRCLIQAQLSAVPTR